MGRLVIQRELPDRGPFARRHPGSRPHPRLVDGADGAPLRGAEHGHVARPPGLVGAGRDRGGDPPRRPPGQGPRDPRRHGAGGRGVAGGADRAKGHGWMGLSQAGLLVCRGGGRTALRGRDGHRGLPTGDGGRARGDGRHVVPGLRRPDAPFGWLRRLVAVGGGHRVVHRARPGAWVLTLASSEHGGARLGQRGVVVQRRRRRAAPRPG